MKKYQVIISFKVTEEFMQLVPPHRIGRILVISSINVSWTVIW